MYIPIISTLTTLSLLSLTTARVLLPRAPNSKISVRSAIPSRPRSIPVVTDNVLEMTKKTGGSRVRSAAKFLKNADIVNGSSTALVSMSEGAEFAADITFGTQTFEVMLVFPRNLFFRFQKKQCSGN